MQATRLRDAVSGLFSGFTGPYDTAAAEQEATDALRVRRNGWTVSAMLLWLALLTSAPFWIGLAAPGWDLDVYQSAIVSVQLGHDPYLDAMSAQREFADTRRPGSDEASPPLGFVYPPFTVALMKLVPASGMRVFRNGYVGVYLLGIALQLWFGLRCATARERRWLQLAAPLALFFPGLLANGTILGGNVAYILYGALLIALLRGWKRNRWGWFYVVVFAAACVKAPLSVLVLIAPLSSCGLWRRTAAFWGSIGALLALQYVIWPTLFLHYLQAVALQLQLYEDFGCSLPGVLTTLLFTRGIRSETVGLVIYLVFAIPLLGFLLFLSGRLRQKGVLGPQARLPMLVGVFLLNPRVVEYDLFPITLPLLLLGSRCIRHARGNRLGYVALCLTWVTCNVLGIFSRDAGKWLTGGFALILLGLSSRQLLQNATLKTRTLHLVGR